MAGFHKVAGSSAGVDRHPNDFYPTPPAVTRALLNVETFPGPVLEPCAGAGHIVGELETHGYEVRANEPFFQGYKTHTATDFLAWRHMVSCQSIVTNPPYRLALEFITKAIELKARKHAWLLRFQFIESKARYQFFQDHPPARVWVFSKRVQVSERGLDNPIGGMIVYAWWVWERGYRGHPEIRWFPPDAVSASLK